MNMPPSYQKERFSKMAKLADRFDIFPTRPFSTNEGVLQFWFTVLLTSTNGPLI